MIHSVIPRLFQKSTALMDNLRSLTVHLTGFHQRLNIISRFVAKFVMPHALLLWPGFFIFYFIFCGWVIFCMPALLTPQSSSRLQRESVAYFPLPLSISQSEPGDGTAFAAMLARLVASVGGGQVSLRRRGDYIS